MFYFFLGENCQSNILWNIQWMWLINLNDTWGPKQWTSELSAFFLQNLCNRCWVARMSVPVCLQKLMFWNWFQLTASEETDPSYSYALEVHKKKYFVPKIPNLLLKSYISKLTKSCLSVNIHSKYGQLTDKHKIYILDKMVMLNPLKYNVIVFSRCRLINK